MHVDYLDAGQGINLGILYTGSAESPIINAVISGIPKGITKVERKTPISNWLNKLREISVPVVTVIVAFYTIVLSTIL